MVQDAKGVASFIAILKAIMRFLRTPFQLIRRDLRVYLIINAISYGFLIAGFVAAMIFPDLVQATVADLETSGASDTVRSLLTSPWLFAPVIFAVNVFSVGLRSIKGVSVLRWATHDESIRQSDIRAAVALVRERLDVVGLGDVFALENVSEAVARRQRAGGQPIPFLKPVHE